MPGSAVTSLRLMGVILCSLTLGSCALHQELGEQANQFERTASYARSEEVLKNIVRASQDKPLTFVNISQMTGSNQIGANFGLPELVFGPNQSPAQHLFIFGGGQNGSGASNFLSPQWSSNFQMNPVVTEDFYRGLLETNGRRTIALLEAQGVPREVLFYLFVDRLTIVDRTGIHVYRNNPSDPTFQGFQKYLELGVRYGLSLEPVAQEPTEESREHHHKGASGLQPSIAICFDPSLASPPLTPAQMRTVSPICGSHAARGVHGAGVYLSQYGRAKVSARPRSIFGVFQYLGRLVALRKRVRLVSQSAIDWSAHSDDILFHLTKGGGDCYLSDDGYCVPQSGAANTTRIIGLLGLLVSLSTSIRDVPFTPTVNIAP